MLGAQRPRLLHVPEYASSLGEEAVELAARAGLELDDWQRFVLLHALGTRPDGKWAAPTVGLTVGRQNGKGALLEARELAGLFLLGERLLIHTAHLQKTATNHFERVLALIQGVPEFEKRVLSAPRGKGAEAIKLRGGRQIMFPTRARGGGRGLSADFVAYDEAMYLSEQDRAALVPTLAAQSMTGNTQSWYVGSAVDQEDSSQDGVPFAQVREQGIAGSAGVAYFEWSAPGDDPNRVPERVASDPEMWALANPGLGIRIAHEWVDHERRVEMGARAFAVERLGVGDWPDTSGDAGRVIGQEAWTAAAEHDRRNAITSAETFAVDCTVDHTWGSIAVAGVRDDGLAQFAVVDHRRGTGWIVARCVALRAERPDCRFAVDARGPAANLIPELKGEGLEPLELSTQDYGDACADFVDAIVHGTVRYPFPQPELDEALSGARQQTLGDRWKWARRSSTSSDISPLVACSIALWAARNAESEFATVLFPGRLDAVEREAAEREALGSQAPRIVSQEEQTSCFACRVGGCTIHQEAQ